MVIALVFSTMTAPPMYQALITAPSQDVSLLESQDDVCITPGAFPHLYLRKVSVT